MSRQNERVVDSVVSDQRRVAPTLQFLRGLVGGQEQNNVVHGSEVLKHAVPIVFVCHLCDVSGLLGKVPQFGEDFVDFFDHDHNRSLFDGMAVGEKKRKPGNQTSTGKRRGILDAS